jgi:Uri superfamily endonuclease
MVHATAIGADLDAVRLVLKAEKRPASVAPPRLPLNDPPEVVAWAEGARKLVEAATGDLLRAAQTRSFGAVRGELRHRVNEVASLAERLRATLPDAVPGVAAPEVATNSSRLFHTPGTYVVVLRVKKAGVVRIARLGTFGLPEGYLLYVGSAFGADGVAGRTARHVGGTGPRLWGVASLRGFAEPVELWWTHHGRKVECDWARALVGMPACSCPAPLAGASDCNRCRRSGSRKDVEQRCPAHLFHTPERLPVGEFAGQLGRSGSGGYEVRCQSAKKALAAGRGAKPPRGAGRADPLSPFG